MNSIAKNEFGVLNFLVRNFTQRFTIRNIAQNLRLSPAGVHSILKKLETSNIVVHEKLGTGLFYSINFDNPIAKHLAAIVLLEGESVKLDVKIDAKAIIATKKDVLAIVDDISVVEEVSVPDANVTIESESSLLEKIRSKNTKILNIFKQGKALLGEDFIVNIINKYQR